MRYFGWLHPSAKRRRMLVENLLEKAIVVLEKPAPQPRWHLLSRVPQRNEERGERPHCERFTLIVVGTLLPIRAPP